MDHGELPKDTEVILVEVRHADSALAVGVANAMMKVAPAVIADTVEVGSINVVDYAKMPETAEPPKHGLNTLIGGVLGLMAGVFAALALQFLFPKVKTGGEVTEKLLMNVLGEIPRGRFEEGSPLLITAREADVRFKEAFKVLSLQIRHMAEVGGIRRILVTSAGEKEGKTTVSMNLALALGGNGRKVLLMECDLHRPSMLRRLNVKGRGKGCLASVLKGEMDPEACIMKSRGVGVDLLPAGHSEEGADLLGSPAMEALLESLEASYDFIIMDTPPAYILSDAAVLSKFADGVAMVIRQEQTPLQVLADTRDSFQKVGARILGTVLNDIRHTGGDYRYKYKYGYDYGYGNKTKKNKPSKWRRLLSWMLVSLWIGTVGAFALQDGEAIVELSERYVASAVETSDFLGALENHSGRAMDKSAGILLQEGQVAYYSRMMQHYIHGLLFFTGTVLGLFAFRSSGLDARRSALCAAGLCLLLALGNEVFQSRFVPGRGFESIDVAFSLLGMGVAYAAWGIKRLALGGFKTP